VKRLFVFVENGRIKTSYGPSELFYGIIGFICAVILSNFVGYIFNAVVGFLGKLFSLSEAFAKPFDTHHAGIYNFSLNIRTNRYRLSTAEKSMENS
jgi:hypothetical protein